MKNETEQLMPKIKKNNFPTTSQTNLYSEARRRYSELLLVKKAKESVLEKAPLGRIRINRTAYGVQYYLRNDKSDKSGKYIHKSEKSKIKQYLQKAYDEKVLKLVTTELQSLKALLNKSESVVNKIRKIYSSFPAEVKEMIIPIDISDEDYSQRWLSEPYEGKQINLKSAFL